MEQLFSAYPGYYSLAISMLMVAYYAFNRFDTPRDARSQTSRVQYWGSRLSYVASCLGLLLLLTWVLINNPTLFQFLDKTVIDRLPELSNLEKPLIAALIMTTLLPAFPGLREVDQRVLAVFHRMGAIPFGARRWSQQMDAATFRISPPMMLQLRRFIDGSALLPERLTAELQPDPDGDKARFRFTRNLSLYVSIQSLPGRARFADEYPEETKVFEERIRAFFAQSVAYFALTGQISGEPLENMSEVLRDARDNFNTSATAAYEALRLMLAQLLLYSCRGEHEVARRLLDVGFTVQTPNPVRIPMNQLALDLIGVVAIFAAATYFRPHSQGLAVALWVGGTTAVGHCIAALFAVVPKQLWSFADLRCSDERPILAYLASAVFTCLTVLPINFAFYCLRPIILGQPSSRTFSQHCTWLILPTVMALALAFACDNYGRERTEPKWLAWAEAIGMAAIIAGAGFLAVQLLEQAGVPRRSSVLLPIATGAAMGALFGGTIPRWYRRMLRRAELPAPLAPTLSGSDAIQALPAE
jgi:putative flippase GtrA